MPNKLPEHSRLLASTCDCMSDINAAVRLAALFALSALLKVFSKEELTTQFGNVVRPLLAVSNDDSPIVHKLVFRCFITVAETKCCLLAPHIQKLLALSCNVMKYAIEETALEAIELWNTIADLELEDESHQFILGSLNELVTALWECMITENEEFVNYDEWTTSIAAITLLGSIAKIAKIRLVQLLTQRIFCDLKHSG